MTAVLIIAAAAFAGWLAAALLLALVVGRGIRVADHRTASARDPVPPPLPRRGAARK